MRTVTVTLLLMLVFALPVQASKADAGLLRREAILDEIFRKNAASFGLPFELIKAIARQESWCRPLVINVAGRDYHPGSVKEALALCRYADERNLQYDVGIMQINRYWIRKYRIPFRMLLDPKDNIYMGCFILSNEVKRHGLNWNAVGRYHSHTTWRRIDYANRIRRHLVNILAQR